MHDYRERLRVPLAWWLLAVPTVLILGATLFAGLAEPWPVIIMTGFAASCAAFLITLGLATVEIRNGALRAGNAVLPLTAVSEVVSLDEKQTTRLRGPRADLQPTCIRDLTSRSRSIWPWPRRTRRLARLRTGLSAPGSRRSWPPPSKGAEYRPATNQWHDCADEGSGRGDKEAAGWQTGKRTLAPRW